MASTWCFFPRRRYAATVEDGPCDRHGSSWAICQTSVGMTLPHDDPRRGTPPRLDETAAVIKLYPVGEWSFKEFALRPGAPERQRKRRIRALCRSHSQPGGRARVLPGSAATTASRAPEATLERTAGSAPTASTP